MERKMVFIKVTTESLYTFDEGQINGWTTKQVIDDWFKEHDMGEHHATRDGHQIGNSTYVKNIKVLNERQEERHCKKVGSYFYKIREEKRKRKEEWEKETELWRNKSWVPGLDE